MGAWTVDEKKRIKINAFFIIFKRLLIVRFWAFPVREDGKGFCVRVLKILFW